MQDLRKRTLTVALPIEKEGEEAMGIEDLMLWQIYYLFIYLTLFIHG